MRLLIRANIATQEDRIRRGTTRYGKAVKHRGQTLGSVLTVRVRCGHDWLVTVVGVAQHE